MAGIAKVAEKIKKYIDEAPKELVDRTTFDEIVHELIAAGVAGDDLRGGMRNRGRFLHAYEDVCRAIDIVCKLPGYVLHVETGAAMLGFRGIYWSSEPFKLFGEIPEPSYQERFFVHCPKRQQELVQV